MLATTLVCGLFGAGCFSDHGLAIEINVGETGATTVELFLGARPCTDDSSASIRCQDTQRPGTADIAPPGAELALHGNVWFRDGAKQYIAEVHGTTATFRIEADQEMALPIVVAIGTGGSVDAAITLHDLTVPAHAARAVAATLIATHAVAPRPVDFAGLTEDRAQVWVTPGAATTSSSCVVVERWVAGQVTRHFIVPSDDPDCDGFVGKNDCNPAAFNGTAAEKNDKISCLVPPTLATDPCVLGAMGCSDGATTGKPVCASPANPVCIPRAACGCPNGTFNEDCIKTLTATPRIMCTFPSAPTLCASRQVTENLSAHFPTGCPKPLIASFSQPNFDAPVFDTKHLFHTVELDVSSDDGACGLRIEWKGDAPVGIGAEDDHGVIKLAGPGGTVLLPIVLHYPSEVMTCQGGATFHCEFDDVPDTMWGCVAP